VDDVTKRVFDLAKGCIEELYKQKEYIQYLEDYIGELENGVEMSAPESVQLEQPMEMEESNDNLDNGRPSVVRNRKAESRNKTATGSTNKESIGISDSDGRDTSTSLPIE
jgi:hypothetical protein